MEQVAEQLESENEHLRQYSSDLARTIEDDHERLHQYHQRLREALREVEQMKRQLRFVCNAVHEGGFVAGKCDTCGKPIICLDSGEGGLCRKCAEKMEAEQ